MQSLPQLVADRTADLYEFFRRLYGPRWKATFARIHGVKLPKTHSYLSRSTKRYLAHFAAVEALAVPFGFDTFERNLRDGRSDRGAREAHASSCRVNSAKSLPLDVSIVIPPAKRAESLVKPMPIMGLRIPSRSRGRPKQVPCQRSKGAKTTPPDSLTPPRAILEPSRGPDDRWIPGDVVWET